MSKIADLIAAEVRAAEQEADAPDLDLPKSVRVTRGHDRSKVLQVRLNDDEYRILDKLAAERGVPVSTFARSLLLKATGI